MIIDRDIRKYIVFSEDTILHALEKISLNKKRIVFAVSEAGILEGVFTDGDFRRWLTSGNDFDLHRPVIDAANKAFLSFPETVTPGSLESRFSDRIEYIPLVDDHQRLVGVAGRRSAELELLDRTIGPDSPCFIIAEIGLNHNGSPGLAQKLVDAAAEAGADCAKFQMRDMDTLYRQFGTQSAEDLGTEYTLDLLARFQLTAREQFALFDHCRDKGLVPMCTPYDQASLDKLKQYGMPAYKIASADLTNDDLLQALAETGRPLICSTGMSREQEIVHAVNLLRSRGAGFVLLHCNSTYPTPFKDVQLRYMDRLKEIGDCPVGYSGHERGIAVPLAAVGLGARVVEKHITLDRTMEGRDHRVSLLPQEFADMVRGIRDVEEALGHRDRSRELTQGELINRETLAKSLVASREIETGTVITEKMLDVRSPGMGLAPYHKPGLIGRIARRTMHPGDFFYPSDLEDHQVTPGPFRFSRPWGIPARFHDVDRLLSLTSPDFIEFHLSYKDLEAEIDTLFEAPLSIDFTVHTPELFAGDHILDLCSPDEQYRKHSIAELQRVIDLTRRLRQWFPATTRPFVITNMGGFSMHAHIPALQRGPLYERMAESLAELDLDGVELLPQTMPPFPWHFGGQRYHNLFMDPQEIADFCRKHDMRVCLDVSHSKLACTHFKWSFAEFLAVTGPYTAHLHIADASGVDGEGLQIGEGEIDFKAMADLLREYAPEAWFIPEVWQGHKNDGEGFWKGLHLLQGYGY
jgi:N-acetylneuraminate synthase